jgi:hypothetical protein
MLFRLLIITFIVHFLSIAYIHPEELHFGIISVVRKKIEELLAEEVKKDKKDSPPKVVILSPAANSELSGKVDIIAEASDDKGIAKVEFYIDAVLKSTSTAAPYSYSWDTTQYSNGPHTVKLIAYDTIGQSASVYRIVIVNNVDRAPSASIIAPVEGSTVTMTVNVVVAAYDDKGISKVEFYVDDALKFVSATSTAPSSYACSWSWDTTQYIEGLHTVKVIAYDSIGQTAVAQCTVTVKYSGDSGVSDRFIQNGNFEQGYSDYFPNVPKYWEPELPQKNYSSVLSLDQSVVWEGTYSLRMVAPQNGEWDVGPIFQTSDYDTVTPGKTYELTAWIKSEGKEWQNEWCVITMQWMTNDGQPLGEVTIPESERAPANYDWKKFTIRGVAPEGARRLRVKLLQHFGHGKTWFDDIKVKEINQ